MATKSRGRTLPRGVVAGVATALLLASCAESEPGLIDPPTDETVSFDEEGSWTTRAGLPEPLVGVTAAVWRGQVYAIGGYADEADGDATSHVLRIDPDDLDVERLPDFPHPVAEAAAVVYKDTLMVIGGNEGNSLDVVPSSAVWAFDETTEDWIDRGTILDRRFMHTAHVVDDRLYVIGGYGLTVPIIDSIIVIRDDATSYGPPPNRALTNPVVGGVIGDTIFAMGSLFQSTMVRYDAGVDAWAEGLGAPFEGTATGGAASGRFHAFGNGQTPQHRILDPGANAWVTAPPPPAPVSRAAVVGVGTRVILIGGHDRQRVGIRRLQAYDPPN